jgi:invasion protein IalB
MAALALAGTLASPPANAADAFLGRFESWEAHRSGAGKDTYCYIAALPTRSEGKVAKRGEAVLMVAHFPQHKAFGQVEVKTGFALKKGAEVELAIHDKTFKLAGERDSAHSVTVKDNETIVAALKAGKTASATSPSAAGPRVVDIYALAGFSKALAAIDKECGRR